MRFFKCVFILLFIASSCKSNKTIVEMSNLKSMSSRKIVRKHLENSFESKTLDSKIKLRYANTKGKKRDKHQITLRLRMIKDSVIWMRGNKAITVFKAKITPNMFSFYSPISKEYFEGDYSMIEKLLGVNLSFEQLQDLLLGKSIFEMKGKRFSSDVIGNSYKLTPKVQEKLFDVFYKVNPNHFKLDQLFLENEERDLTLQINYNRYDELKEDLVPTRVEIKATKGQDAFTSINMEYRSLKLNEPLKLPFRIPSGYKRIEL